MTWRDYWDESDPSVLEFAQWLASLHPSVLKDVVARFDSLRERAALGRIVIPEDGTVGDLDAIVRDPDLYELRWTVLTKVIRQYHGEPPGLPNDLVNLHIHIKADTVRRELHTDPTQDQEISKAMLRYRAGETRGWGT